MKAKTKRDHDEQPVVYLDEAEAWIEAALAAGITFTRHVAHDPKNTVTYAMEHDQLRGERAVASGFGDAYRMNPKMFEFALDRLFKDKGRWASRVTRRLDGESHSFCNYLSLNRVEGEVLRLREQIANHYVWEDAPPITRRSEGRARP